MFVARYVVNCNETSQEQTINHGNNPDSDRLVTTWTGLRPQQSYTFTVICIIQGKQCPGITPFFNASTVELGPGMHHFYLAVAPTFLQLLLVATAFSTRCRLYKH